MEAHESFFGPRAIVEGPQQDPANLSEVGSLRGSPTFFWGGGAGAAVFLPTLVRFQTFQSRVSPDEIQTSIWSLRGLQYDAEISLFEVETLES